MRGLNPCPTTRVSDALYGLMIPAYPRRRKPTKRSGPDQGPDAVLEPDEPASVTSHYVPCRGHAEVSR